MQNIKIKILTGSSILGAIFVSFGAAYYANLIWSIANPLLAFHNLRIGQKEQYNLFKVFTLAAWFGVIREVLL